MKQRKEPIKIRFKQLKDGSKSIYLDCYLAGKRKYEFLHLYLVPEVTAKDKVHNNQVLTLAEAIKAKKVIELYNGSYGFESKTQGDMSFLEYVSGLRELKKNTTSENNYHTWVTFSTYINNYCKPSTKLNDIDSQWVKGFRKYIDNVKPLRGKRPQLSQNTKFILFRTLKTCFNNALRDGLIDKNPFVGVESFKEEEKERVYLTIDELKRLVATDCKMQSLKRAFLFSCLTGLRKSDIEKMTWGEICHHGEYTRIIFKQKKTGGQEYYDISPQAVAYLGERQKDDELVFHFKYGNNTQNALRKWVKRAGISKDITFHSARHTFAVMMIELGVDLYTVQKLLGHKEIKTTQIYAKITDNKKRDAVSLIPAFD